MEPNQVGWFMVFNATFNTISFISWLSVLFKINTIAQFLDIEFSVHYSFLERVLTIIGYAQNQFCRLFFPDITLHSFDAEYSKYRDGSDVYKYYD